MLAGLLIRIFYQFHEHIYSNISKIIFEKKNSNILMLKYTINPVQLHIFTNVIHCFRLPLWVGYYIINCYISSSIKGKNWLKNKGMCVLLFDVFKHLLFKKLTFSKLVEKINFLERKIWRNALALKNKKVQGTFRETFILALSSAVFYLQNCVSDFF